MKTGRNIFCWLVACLFVGLLAGPVLAATPAEQLQKAIELFQAGKYEQAQETLLGIDRDQLSEERKQGRDELAEEIGTAVNQFNKAKQNIQDAERLFQAGDQSKAEKFYQSVLRNAYATETQKQGASQGLALIAQQRKLQRKLSKGTTSQLADADRASVARPSGLTSKARAQRDRLQAANYIRLGDEALAKGQYDLARKKFQQALKLVPNHPAALHGLELVRQHRFVEGKPNLLDDAEKRKRVRWQRAERSYASSETQIRRLINEQKYDEASQELVIVRQALQAARRDAEPADHYTMLARQLEAIGRLLKTEQADYGRTRAAQQRKEVIAKERERRQADRKERDERIAQLFDQAMQFRRQRQYAKAVDVLKEILTIDPAYERAKWLLETLDDADLIQGQKTGKQDFYNKVQKALLGAERLRTPTVTGSERSIVAYPEEEEWRIIAQREPFGGSGPAETEVDRRTRERLSVVIPRLEIEDLTPLRDVIESLQEEGQISIAVNYNALLELGIEEEVPAMDLRDVKLETVIQLLLDNISTTEAELDYAIIDGILRISTVEDLRRRTITRVYDVRDLLVRVRSFQGGGGFGGGGMGGGGMGGGGMGGGGFGGGGGGGFGGGGGGGFGGGGGGLGGGGGGFGGGGGGFGGGGRGGGGFGGGGGGLGGGGGGFGGGGGQGEGEEEREERIEELIELIQKLVEPGTWQEDEGDEEEGVGTLDVWNERLIVRHTAKTHRKVVELLEQLREFKDIQVGIEARFVTLRSNFLEEIGVDLDVVLNNGNAGLDYGLGEGFPSRAIPGGGLVNLDPVTGGILLQPRQFGRLGFTPAVPGLGTELATQSLAQPYGNVALVPGGRTSNYFNRHTTPITGSSNTMGLAAPVSTGMTGNLAAQVAMSPAFSMFGSFLDNIQVDFLMRATQMDVHSSSVDAPRLVTFNGREAFISVGDSQSFVFQPGFLPTGGSGVGGLSAGGQNPTIGTAFSGRSLSVVPTVSGDRKYVTIEVRPNLQTTTLSIFEGATGPVQLSNTSFTRIGTTVSVPDGGTLLLGGLKLSGEVEVEAGVPVLSKISWLKRAFTNRSRTKDESVLLILVKPTVIIQEEQEGAAFEDLATLDSTGG